MSQAKLHIEGGSGRPAAIKHYIDLIDRREYESAEAVMEDAYVEFGLTRPSHSDRQVNIKNMTTTLARLGIVQDGNRQTLTEVGEQFVDVLIYNKDLFYDLFHFFYSTAYHRDPIPDRTISWSYYQISAAYKRRSPINYRDARQGVVEEVLEQADNMDRDEFAGHGPLSKRSLNNYKWFISELEPKVLNDSGEFQLRSFVEKEVVLGAIDALYRSDTLFETLKYGDRLELSDKATNILSAITLVDEMDLTDVIEHAASMDRRLSVTSDYQLRVRLKDQVEIDGLA